MSSLLVDRDELFEEAEFLEGQLASESGVRKPNEYPKDPHLYFKEILKVEYVWPVMTEIMKACLEPPHRVMVKSGHKTGKSWFAGGFINWFYDNFDPSQLIQIAPTLQSVEDIVWKEVRMHRQRAGLPGLMPKAPLIWSSPDHFAKGMTATCGEALQGRHGIRSCFLFDEGVGIDPVFWEVVRTMFKPEEGHIWIVFTNPTDTTSQAFAEDHSTNADGSPRWRTFTLDCLEHPNVVAALNNQKPPIPAAVSLAQVNEWVETWCDPVQPIEAKPSDLEWPPNSGKWWRQGPIFQARCRGLWPEGGTYSVWSELLWAMCESNWCPVSPEWIPEIGCDVARFGDDYTSFHVRWGHNSVHHESVNGWNLVKTYERLQALAAEWAKKYSASRPASAKPLDPKEIPLKIDDDGLGGGVTDFLQAEGYTVVPIGAGTRSMSGRYPNMRSEVWFQIADRARMGMLGLARLPKNVKSRLRQQAMAVEWAPNAAGQRVVEPKDHTKEKIGRSPDDMDAMNLAYLEGWGMESPPVIEGGTPPKDVMRPEPTRKKGIFG